MKGFYLAMGLGTWVLAACTGGTMDTAVDASADRVEQADATDGTTPDAADPSAADAATAVRYARIEVFTGRSSHRRILVVMARLFAEPPTDSAPPVLATAGACSAYDTSHGSPPWTSLDLGADIVTATVGNGAPQTLTFDAGWSAYRLVVDPPPPPGTYVVVQTRATAGLPLLRQDLLSADIRFATPSVDSTQVTPTLPYTPNHDLAVTWMPNSNTAGDVTLSALNSTGAGTSVSCLAHPVDGTLTAPWSLLAQYAAGDEAHSTLDGGTVALVQTERGSNTQSGVRLDWFAGSEDDAVFAAAR